MAEVLKTNNMNRKASGSGFKMRSTNKTSFKEMGGSPLNKIDIPMPAQVGLRDDYNPTQTPDNGDRSPNTRPGAGYGKVLDNDGIPKWKLDFWRNRNEETNNQLKAEMTSDLESDILTKLDDVDYDADEGSGSLYDYSVRKGSSAITKKSSYKK